MSKIKATNNTSNRLYYLDTMRGLLILSIVCIHSLQVFNPEKTWLIYSNASITLSPYIIQFLMLFVLSSFFIMSGYLAAMSIDKLGIKKFFDSRIKRTFIPIIVTALTLNTLQAYLLTRFNNVDITIYNYITEGKWVSHLWFLIDLAIFFLFTYITITILNSAVKRLNYLFNLIFEKTGVHIILFLISFFILTLVILFSILSPYIYNKIIDIKSIFFYFPFFTLGILLFKNKFFFNKFVQIPIISTLFIAIISTYFAIHFSECTNNIGKITHNFFNASSTIFASTLCFILFYKFFNKKSKLFLFLAEASYSIYLFHHLLVIVGGIVLIKFNIGGYLGFLALLLFATFFSLAIHYFIVSKSNLLAFLYNGKKLKGKK